MQSTRTVALCCLLLCLSSSVLATMSAGNIETSSYLIAGPCTQASQAKTNSPLCTTFCRSGDCSKPANLYSYALPGQGVLNGVQPSQVVTSSYQISVTDPTVVGVVNNNSIVIFSCRDSNCADYNQATYLAVDGSTLGRSIAASLTKDSSLSILYTKKKASGEYDLMLDICKDPVCTLRASSNHIDTLISDADVWLGFDVNRNVPLIVVSNSHTQTIVSYACSGTTTLTCQANSVPLVHTAVNAFSLMPYQTGPTKKPKAPLVTKGFILAFATYSPQNRTSEIFAYACASDLSVCTPNTVNALPEPQTMPVLSLSIIPTATQPGSSFQLAYSTLDVSSTSAAVYLAECSVGQKCPTPATGNYSLGFQPDMHSFELDVVLLYSPDSGYTAMAQSSNAWVASDSPPASALYGLSSSSFFAVQPKKFEVSKYHKPPPKVTIPILVLAGVAGLSTIGIVIWRVLAGSPPTPGYTRIN